MRCSWVSARGSEAGQSLPCREHGKNVRAGPGPAGLTGAYNGDEVRFALSGASSRGATMWTTGDRVLAQRLPGEFWYPGVIRHIQDDRFFIIYDDGEDG